SSPQSAALATVEDDGDVDAFPRGLKIEAVQFLVANVRDALRGGIRNQGLIEPVGRSFGLYVPVADLRAVPGVKKHAHVAGTGGLIHQVAFKRIEDVLRGRILLQ